MIESEKSDFIYTKGKLYPSEKFVPGPKADGLHLEQKVQYYFQDCIVDMRDYDLYDEAVGLTHGAVAVFSRCRFLGADKLFLIGSGDSEFREAEEKASVYFDHCYFSDFCRRGPEIQCGTHVEMNDCLIVNWGDWRYWDTRAFGIWVHDKGELIIKNSIFMQGFPNPPLWYRIRDKVSHVGQAINDHGLKALFQKRSWVSGWLRACTVDGDGWLKADKCWRDDPHLIIDNLTSEMSEKEAKAKLVWFYDYFNELQYLVTRSNDAI